MPRTLRLTIGSMPYWQAKISARALHILQQLRLEGSEPAILLRTLQRELLLLVTLKRQATVRRCARCLINIGSGKTAVSCSGDALTRLSGEQLRQAVTF